MATMYRVEMADGRELTVATDQRDWAAMEALEFPTKATTLQARHMCWTALRRGGVSNIADWPRFNEHDCISVQLAGADVDVDESDGEDEQRLNPGRTTPNGDGGSSSRSRRGNRSPRAASLTGTTGT